MIAQKSKENLNPKKEKQSPRVRNPRSFLIVIALITIVASVLSLSAGVSQHFWPLFLLAAVLGVSFVIDIFALTPIWNAPMGVKMLSATFAIEISLAVAGGVISFAYGLPFAFLAVAIAFIFAAYNPTGWLNDWIIGLGLIGGLGSTLLGVLTPIPQITNQILNYSVIALDLAAIIVLILLIRLGFVTASLRLKLILASLSLSIIPLIILAVINLRSVQSTISAQSNDTLRIATELTVNKLDDFFTSNLATLKTEASLPAMVSYLELGPNERLNSPQEIALIATLKSLQTKETLYAPSYGLINLVGQVVYDTNRNKIGRSELNTDYFQNSSATHTAYASTVEFLSGTRESYLYFIAPILTSNQSIIGYLRVSYDARILQTELENSTGLVGAHSYPVLLDENGIRLADTSNPAFIYHSIQPLDASTYANLLGAGRIPGYIAAGQISSPITEIADALFVNKIKPYQFFNVDMQGAQTGILDSATYGALTTQSWYVVYLQEQTALVEAQNSLTQSTAVIAVLIASIVSILITVVSNLFTQPIVALTDTAQVIADGSLDAQVTVRSNDEIGALGKAFNSMAQQLKSSFEDLENRVRQRTQEIANQNDALRYRSRQLQTVTDVARIIVSKNDMESLLTLVTDLISDRFNFYHAGIFLMDDKNEFAVLRASNSPGGQRMLNRQHKLKVGQIGIVGYVTGSGLPRIATDVGKDAVFFNNPDLPETKSEMALPLKIEDRVIGALDIQSTESNAFTEEDIALFTTLADQISVAISNNQLLENTQKALAEAQNLHRQYLNQEWTKRAEDTGRTSYKYTAKGLSTYDEDLPEVKMVFESGRPVTRSAVQGNADNKAFSTLAVPILLRGEVIGVIHLQENEGSLVNWSENELVTVQTLADQLAQTLESARLFEQTIRRADRERRVLEITSKIRSTNDPQQMLEITLEELKRHLGASQAQIVINLPGQPSPNESSTGDNKKPNVEA
ncbi:MAG: GAF domain-containing protein [Anaerolineaceae bacterium]